MTIRRRLLLLLLPALTILMLIGALVDRWIATATTQDAYDQALAAVALAAAAYVEVDHGALRAATLADVDGLRTELAAGPVGSSAAGARVADTRFYAIRQSNGALLAGTPALPALPLASAAGKPVFGDSTFQGEHVRVVSLWVASGEGQRTIVTVAETRARRAQAERVMLFGKLVVQFAELDFMLLLIWSAVYFGLRPLARLRAQAEMQSARELHCFDEQDVPGELRPLVVAFNRVLELLHAAASAQRRFVADAAHQMRTPVAGLLAQLEVLRAEPRAQPIGAELATLQRATQSLAHSANQLLALARAEPAAAGAERFTVVALDELVKQLVERHLERADQAGIDFGAEALPGSVDGDTWLLEDLLGNLIDNALKYTPSGGRVTVRSGAERGCPYLEVEDDGAGIPEAERQRVRERFYRRPGSPGFGTGLGLAIVEEIARAHEATFIIAAGAQGRGTRMRVNFRAAASEQDSSRPQPLIERGLT